MYPIQTGSDSGPAHVVCGGTFLSTGMGTGKEGKMLSNFNEIPEGELM
jgi:hypothetical protein